jgi:hypothetical protein
MKVTDKITIADVTNKICLALDIISIPSGVPENLTVQLV